MKLSALLSQEENGKIQLYKQGVFWRAYEQSAYYIWKGRRYRVSCTFVKNIKRNVISLGFPDSALKTWQYENENTLLKETENYRLFLAPSLFEEIDFLNWRENREAESHNEGKDDSLEQRLRDYPLEKKTPVEAFLFLQELRESIRK